MENKEKSAYRTKIRTAGKIFSAACICAMMASSACFCEPAGVLVEGAGYEEAEYEQIETEGVSSEFDEVDVSDTSAPGIATEETSPESTEDTRVLFSTGLIEDSGDMTGETAPPAIREAEAEEETRVSIEGESEQNQLRQEIVDFAKQFVGNPYVWGGTSLTNGADCSGFCLSVYAHFGITIPRVACDQAAAGRRIPLSEALPGDLVFYMDGSGYVYHAALCSGEGTTVQAQNSRVGIVNTGMNGASFACRYFD